MWWAELCVTYPAIYIELGVSTFVMIIGFWIPATFYQLIDTIFPNFAAAHKIQADPKRHPTSTQVRDLVFHAIYICLFDIWIQIVFSYATRFRSLFVVSPYLPSFRDVANQWVFALLAREVLAYYIHRALHHPLMYIRFHKKHHSFTAPIAFSALYTTLTEHVIADVIPIVGPLAVLSATIQPVHIFSFSFFLLTLYAIGTAEHSGFDFAQPGVSRTHDLHHEKFAVNYGSLHFMDWMHGTDVFVWDRPVERQEKRRHKHQARESQVGVGYVLKAFKGDS